MIRKLVLFSLVTVPLISVALRPLHAQVTAQITGTIEDPHHAAVAGAKVEITNEATGIERKTATDESGAYTAALLQPGTYRIKIDAAGFRPLSRTGILLQVAQTATVNFELQVGSNEETVTVTEEVPLLDTSTDAIGGVVAPAQVENLPMLGRNSNSLMVLEPGVVATRQTTANPVLESHYQFFSINGSRPDQSQFLLDGGNDTNLAFNGPEYTPGVEEVQEYRIQTSNFSAEYGNSAGGVINISTKSGTNQFHGSLFEYIRNDIFSANNFFSNQAGVPRAKLRYNQFGGTVGGPIFRNKAFFFFAYEGLRQITPDVVTTSVPTAAQRSGDFSQTLNASGALLTIYDPSSTVPDPSSPGNYIRTAFPGNKIPQARLDPVALAIEKYFPAANQTGNPGTGLNNFIFSGGNIQHTNNFSGRGDYQLNANTQIMGRYSIEELSPWVVPATFGSSNIASPGYVTKPQHHPYALGKVIRTFSPTFFGEFHGSWARWFYTSRGLSNGFDPTTLGFPAYLSAHSAGNLGFPSISPGEMSGLGNYYYENDSTDRYEFAANISKVWTKHTLKIGGLYGLGLYPVNTIDNTTGTYASTNAFTQGPNPLSASTTSGFGFASFLLGTMSSGTQDPTRIIGNYKQPYYGLYVEDDVKVNRNLTVTLGLRWDVESPRTEAHNRMSNFDFTTTSSLSNGTAVTGGLKFPGVNGVSNGDWQSNNKNFAPRVGFAYSLNSSTVVRAGYGIFFGNSWGNGRNNNSMPQYGFFCSTQVNISNNNGLTPAATLSNPFPTGFCVPSGSSAGLQTGLGQTVYFINRNYQTPYLQSWNLDIQRSLPGNMVVQIAYSGSRGVHLNGIREYNQLNPKYFGLGAALNGPVANPYYGIITSGPLAGPTITLGQSLRPFPQYTDVSSRIETFGESSYNAMFLSFQKRMSKGLLVSASWTWAKEIDDVIPAPNGFSGSSFSASNPQNFYNPRAERSVASFDTPNTVVISYIYEFPFGSGKPFLNTGGAVGRLVGGWQINGLTTFQSGTPLQVSGGNSSGSFDGTQRPNWTGKNPTLGGAVTQRLNRYFDTSQFTFNAPFTFGTAPRLVPTLFQEGINNWDMSLIKDTLVREEITVELRAEVFNTFNRVQFSPPNLSINSSAFGVISGQQNSPRTMQFGIRVKF
jgi:Carboxypeptidase regulatory-like domain